MPSGSFQDIIQSDIPTLIDFKAEWCAPCHQMSPVLQTFAQKHQGKVKVI